MSKRAPYTLNDVPAGTQYYWRSLEEKERDGAPAPGFDATREFSADQLAAPSAGEVNRRGFFAAMGSVLALAGAEGCRRPVEKIVPYAKAPEEVIPGIPSHYASAVTSRGESLGIVLECHEGRPTKVEGNPDHSSSMGGADIVTQATLLDLYDPDRSTGPSKGPAKDSKGTAVGATATWDDFEQAFADVVKAQDANGGAKLRVLLPPTISPTVMRLRAELKNRFPSAKIHTYAPTSHGTALAGARLAFGQP
ncbi:MAG: molybdopterin oxidoreductase, partial [Polyangiaceae bacterium]